MGNFQAPNLHPQIGRRNPNYPIVTLPRWEDLVPIVSKPWGSCRWWVVTAHGGSPPGGCSLRVEHPPRDPPLGLIIKSNHVFSRADDVPVIGMKNISFRAKPILILRTDYLCLTVWHQRRTSSIMLCIWIILNSFSNTVFNLKDIFRILQQSFVKSPVACVFGIMLILNESSMLEWSGLNPRIIEHSFVNPIRSIDTRKKSRWENTFWGLIFNEGKLFLFWMHVKHTDLYHILALNTRCFMTIWYVKLAGSSYSHCILGQETI